MKSVLNLKGAFVFVLALAASAVYSEVGNIKIGDVEVDPPTTTSVKLAIRATAGQWERALPLCHDHLTSHVVNSPLPDAVKITYVSAIPNALRAGGVREVWRRGNQALRKVVMNAAADALEEEASLLEARATLLRRFATAIDNNAASYTTTMEPIFQN